MNGKIAIRVDSSDLIGTGHVMRCLTLAGFLREQGAEVTFVSRELSGHRIDFIESEGYAVLRMSPAGPETRVDSSETYARWLAVPWHNDAAECLRLIEENLGTLDWLVVDNYALDQRWESQLSGVTNRIMVIDDLADRPHRCDLLLDQNLHQQSANRYSGRVPERCELLVGPRYALLRPEFIRERPALRVRDGAINRILVFYGGNDPSNETLKALEAIAGSGPQGPIIDVVVGSGNSAADQIRTFAADHSQVHYHYQVNHMASLMSQADLALGGAGTTTWERAYLGLPAIITVLADNQREAASQCAAVGAALNLGWYENVQHPDIKAAVQELVSDPGRTARMSRKAYSLFDNETPGVQLVGTAMMSPSGVSKQSAP